MTNLTPVLKRIGAITAVLVLSVLWFLPLFACHFNECHIP